MLDGTLPLTAELPNAKSKTNIPVKYSGTGIKVFPVPAQSSLNIEGVDPGEKYQVFDRLGIKRMEGCLFNDHINISGLHPGLYIIRFEDGNRIFSKY